MYKWFFFGLFATAFILEVNQINTLTMNSYRGIDDIESDLRMQYGNLFSDFEVLSLAIQIQRNEILVAGLVIDQSDNRPTALEAIAMQLGQKSDRP